MHDDARVPVAACDMRGVRRGLLSAALVAAALALCGARAEEPDPAQRHFLWRADSATATVYLFGSIHVGREDLYPLPDVVEAAFTAADTLVLELPMDAQSRMLALHRMMQAALFAPGGTLSADLPVEIRADLDAYLARRELTIDRFDRFRPWFVATMITLAETLRAGYDPEHGIDVHLHARAAGAKRLLALESVEQQVRVLAGMSREVQHLFLRAALAQVDDTSKAVERILDAWKTGDTTAMEQVLLQPVRDDPALRPVFEALFEERNARMVEKIALYLEQRGTFFVVVGAGHLVGEAGIPDLLRKRDIAVRAL